MNVFSDRIAAAAPADGLEAIVRGKTGEVVDFSGGNPSPEAFPAQEIRRVSDEILSSVPLSALQNPPVCGLPTLVGQLREKLCEKGCFREDEDGLVITSGVVQCAEIAAKIICNEGETVICDSLCGYELLTAFRSYRARIVGVPSDGDGMRADLLDEALKKYPRTAFICLTPDFQDPTGTSMPEERRREILAAAQKHGVMILECAPYSTLRFSGADIPPIKSMDTKGCVLYAGGFDCVLAPGLKTGFLAGPENIIKLAQTALRASLAVPSAWQQLLTYRLISADDIEEKLENTRQLYREKCGFMLGSLQFSMPRSVQISEPEGGLFLWLTLPEGDLDYYCKKLLANGAAVAPGNLFSVDAAVNPLSLRLNFAALAEPEVERGVEIISRISKEFYR